MQRRAARGRRGVVAAIGLVLALSTAQVRACPVCDSTTGEQVRRGIFGDDFATNLAASLLPFPIFVILVGVIHGRSDGSTADERADGREGGRDA